MHISEDEIESSIEIFFSSLKSKNLDQLNHRVSLYSKASKESHKLMKLSSGICESSNSINIDDKISVSNKFIGSKNKKNKEIYDDDFFNN